MGRSLRVTTRRADVGNTPGCLLARSARQRSTFEMALDPRFAGDTGLTIPQSVRLCADEVIE
jgi:hypothetical protein